MHAGEGLGRQRRDVNSGRLGPRPDMQLKELDRIRAEDVRILEAFAVGFADQIPVRLNRKPPVLWPRSAPLGEEGCGGPSDPGDA